MPSSARDDDKFTAERAIRMVNTRLTDMGFAPRDADPSDFQRANDRTLRFKTGAAYAEVSVLPMVDNKQQPAIRATSWAGVERLMLVIGGLIDNHDKQPEGRR